MIQAQAEVTLMTSSQVIFPDLKKLLNWAYTVRFKPIFDVIIELQDLL